MFSTSKARVFCDHKLFSSAQYCPTPKFSMKQDVMYLWQHHIPINCINCYSNCLLPAVFQLAAVTDPLTGGSSSQADQRSDRSISHCKSTILRDYFFAFLKATVMICIIQVFFFVTETGWWFPKDCGEANPNGPYQNDPRLNSEEMQESFLNQQLEWMRWGDTGFALKTVSMQIIPREALIESDFSTLDNKQVPPTSQPTRDDSAADGFDDVSAEEDTDEELPPPYREISVQGQWFPWKVRCRRVKRRPWKGAANRTATHSLRMTAHGDGTWSWGDNPKHWQRVNLLENRNDHLPAAGSARLGAEWRRKNENVWSWNHGDRRVYVFSFYINTCALTFIHELICLWPAKKVNPTSASRKKMFITNCGYYIRILCHRRRIFDGLLYVLSLIHQLLFHLTSAKALYTYRPVSPNFTVLILTFAKKAFVQLWK